MSIQSELFYVSSSSPSFLPSFRVRSCTWTEGMRGRKRETPGCVSGPLHDVWEWVTVDERRRLNSVSPPPPPLARSTFFCLFSLSQSKLEEEEDQGNGTQKINCSLVNCIIDVLRERERRKFFFFFLHSLKKQSSRRCNYNVQAEAFHSFWPKFCF